MFHATYILDGLLNDDYFLPYENSNTPQRIPSHTCPNVTFSQSSMCENLINFKIASKIKTNCGQLYKVKYMLEKSENYVLYA
jgi:hypothetical protein